MVSFDIAHINIIIMRQYLHITLYIATVTVGFEFNKNELFRKYNIDSLYKNT